MKIRFSLSSGEKFIADAPDGSDMECRALPRDADRFDFWRRKTGDDRIIGHAMVWEVVHGVVRSKERGELIDKLAKSPALNRFEMLPQTGDYMVALVLGPSTHWQAA